MAEKVFQGKQVEALLDRSHGKYMAEARKDLALQPRQYGTVQRPAHARLPKNAWKDVCLP